MKEIKTNYEAERYSYPLCSGNNKEGWTMKLKDFKESEKEFYERLVKQGYTNIKFYEVATRIRGLHDLIAYVK